MMRLAAVALAAVPPALLAAVGARESVLAAVSPLYLSCMNLGAAMIGHTRSVLGGAVVVAMLMAAIGLMSAWRQLRRTDAALHRYRLRAPVDARVRRIAGPLGLEGRVDVAESDALFACCYGFTRPRVMLSAGIAGALGDDELEAVLRHEAAHLRRHDPLRILLARSLARACALIPMAPLMLDAYLCQREIDADRDTVRAMGDAKPLAGALYRMLRSVQPPQLASLAVGALVATDVRIDRLLGEPTSPLRAGRVGRVHGLAFTAAAAALACNAVAVLAAL
ncbi:MAG: M56 family metallopeptidase [Dehalococcoidia bacterium]|nr:M56 family metallopeptidase [Dehalococcoidia bacterium]